MKTILLAAGALLITTAAAEAQVAPSAPQPPRDGVQTRTEAVERVRTMFARVDGNRDGAITAEEAKALRARAGGQRHAQRGGEGRRAQMFDRLDSNRDNMISREEWARAEALRAERRAGRGEQGMRAHRLAMRGRMGGAMLRQVDADGDRRVTLQEAESAVLQRFDRVDVNRDGRITLEERQQARQQMQQRRQQVRN